MSAHPLLLPLLAGMLLGSSGCDKLAASPQPQQLFRAADISGAGFGRAFALTDHKGRARTLADYRGKVVALLFGYVHCPDMCPLTLHELRRAQHALGAQGSGLQVLFVTLDPQHDTQAALAQAMANFDPAFVGLRGDAAQTRQVIGDFRLVLQRLAAAGKDAGEIGHSAGTYVFDRHGKLRLYAAYGTAHEAFEHDFRLLLSER